MGVNWLKTIFLVLLSSFIGIMSNPDILTASDSVAVVDLDRTSMVETVEEPKTEQEQMATERPVTEEEEPTKNIPLLEFCDDHTAPPSAELLISELIEKNLCTEQDFAAYLYRQGWKLQEPVRSYKKFTL